VFHPIHQQQQNMRWFLLQHQVLLLFLVKTERCVVCIAKDATPTKADTTGI
jgi:hypothetical protein